MVWTEDTVHKSDDLYGNNNKEEISKTMEIDPNKTQQGVRIEKQSSDVNKVVQVVDITTEKEQDTATKSNSYQQQIVVFEQKAKKDEEQWDSDNRDRERHKDESLVESIQQTARKGTSHQDKKINY